MCPKSTSQSNNTVVNICLNTLNNTSNFLLPVIEIGVQGFKGPTVKFNALLDTGSSRSYLSKSVMDKLELKANNCRNVEYMVTTFLGCGQKLLKEANLEVHLPSGRHNVMPFLIDDSF